jgi:hypothetical protein
MEDINWNDPLFSWFSLRAIEGFKKFHEKNPHVYSEFKRLAHEIKATGRKKYSVDAIIHVIRWNYDIQTTGRNFKISNNIRSIYGRLLAYQEPEFNEFFNKFRNKREMKDDERIRAEIIDGKRKPNKRFIQGETILSDVLT